MVPSLKECSALAARTKNVDGSSHGHSGPTFGTNKQWCFKNVPINSLRFHFSKVKANIPSLDYGLDLATCF
jgi:hypothetical protein